MLYFFRSNTKAHGADEKLAGEGWGKLLTGSVYQQTGTYHLPPSYFRRSAGLDLGSGNRIFMLTTIKNIILSEECFPVGIYKNSVLSFSTLINAMLEYIDKGIHLFHSVICFRVRFHSFSCFKLNAL